MRPRCLAIPPHLDLGDEPAAHVTACVEIVAEDPVLTQRARDRAAAIVAGRKYGRPRKPPKEATP